MHKFLWKSNYMLRKVNIVRVSDLSSLRNDTASNRSICRKAIFTTCWTVSSTSKNVNPHFLHTHHLASNTVMCKTKIHGHTI